jgi:hypothetical protein
MQIKTFIDRKSFFGTYRKQGRLNRMNGGELRDSNQESRRMQDLDNQERGSGMDAASGVHFIVEALSVDLKHFCPQRQRLFGTTA